MNAVFAALAAHSGSDLIPAAPTNFQAVSGGTDQIDQSWDWDVGSKSAVLNGFPAQIATDAAFSNIIGTAFIPVTTRAHSWTGLASNTTYYTRIRASNGTGASDWATASGTTSSVPAPAAPSANEVIVSGVTTATQSWTDNASTEIGFTVQRATNSSFSAGLVSVDVAADTTSHAWTGLTEGTRYWYRVRANGTDANSAWSNVDAASQQLAAPTDMTATAMAGFYRLSWTDNSAHESNYELWSDSGGGFSLTATLSANTTTYDTSQGPADQIFKARATGTAPDSVFSNTATVPAGSGGPA